MTKSPKPNTTAVAAAVAAVAVAAVAAVDKIQEEPRMDADKRGLRIMILNQYHFLV
jgi:hypothetical protein